MTYNTYEYSQNLGRPVELFLFRYNAGGQRWAYTNAERSLFVVSNGVTYEPSQVSRTELRQQLSETISVKIDVRVPLTSDVARLFSGYLPVRPLLLTIHRLHLDDPDQEIRVVFTGEISSCVKSDIEGVATLSAASISEGLRRVIPIQVYQSQCNWTVFSPGCGLDKEAYRANGPVLSQTGAILSVATLGASPNGTYTNGWVERDTGETRFVLSHTGASVVLTAPFSAGVVGETVKIYPGCMQTESDCLTRYNNLNRHLGWPRIPNVNPFETTVFGR